MEKVGVESISKNISATKEYVKSQGNTIYLFFITLLLMIAGIFLIKNSFLKYPLAAPHAKLLKAKEITVDYTIWGILFLVLVLLRLFFPNTPILFSDVLIL